MRLTQIVRSFVGAWVVRGRASLAVLSSQSRRYIINIYREMTKTRLSRQDKQFINVDIVPTLGVS